MTWDDVAQSYANLGWGEEGRGSQSGLRRFRSFDSRLRRSLTMTVWRGDFAPRGLIEIAEIADIARDRKNTTYHGGTETRRRHIIETQPRAAVPQRSRYFTNLIGSP